MDYWKLKKNQPITDEKYPNYWVKGSQLHTVMGAESKPNQ
jgi:hypothetical protein